MKEDFAAIIPRTRKEVADAHAFSHLPSAQITGTRVSLRVAIRAMQQDLLIDEVLLEKVVRALGLDGDKAKALQAEDYRIRKEAREKWVNEPVPTKIITRLMPGIYIGKSMPQGLIGVEPIE